MYFDLHFNHVCILSLVIFEETGYNLSWLKFINLNKNCIQVHVVEVRGIKNPCTMLNS